MAGSSASRSTALVLLTAMLAPVPPIGAQAPEPSADSATFRLPSVHVDVARLSVGGIPLARAPFAAHTIDADELAGRAGATLADALATLPGISVADAMGSALQPDVTMRGFNVSPVMGVPQAVSVFVDGVRVNEPDASQVNFHLIPLRDAARVDVLRGRSGAFGKNALAGSINVVTRRGDEPGAGRVEVSHGSFGRLHARAVASGTSGRADYYLSGRHTSGDGWRDDAFTRLRHLFAKLGWRDGPIDLWVSYQLASDSILQAGSLPASWLEDADAIPARYRREGGDARRINFTGGDYYGPRLHRLTARATYEIDDALGLEMLGFHRRNDSEQFNANFVEPDIGIESAVRSTGGVAQLRYSAGAVDAVGGVEYSFNVVDLGIFRYPNARHPDLPESGLRTEDVGTREHDAALFAQTRVEPTSRLGLTASLRYDQVWLPYRDRLEPSNGGDHRFRQLTGSAGVDVLVRPGATAFAGYGRGFRPPVLMELACADPGAPCPLPYELGADPPLDPVTTDTWQAGARIFRGDRYRAELVAYRADVHDEIFFVQPAETRAGFFRNLGRTRRQGLELAATASPADGLRLQGSITYTRATFETVARLWAPYLDDDADAGDGAALEAAGDLAPPTVAPGDRLPMVPAVRAGLGLEATLHGWRVAVHGSGTGAQWLRGDEGNERPGLRLRAYTLVDAHVSRAFGPATFRATVENVLDRAYETFGVLALNRLNDADDPMVEPFLTPGPPRRVSASVRVRLW